MTLKPCYSKCGPPTSSNDIIQNSLETENLRPHRKNQNLYLINQDLRVIHEHIKICEALLSSVFHF